MIGRSWHGGLSGPLMVVHFRLAPPLRRPPLTHTQLGHTQLTHHTTSSHTTYSHTTSSHTTSSHTTCHHTTCHPTTYSHTTCRHGSSLCVAGVALMALGWLWWRAWFPVDAVGAAALCVAGVALGDMDRHFAARMALMALGWLWWCAWFPVDAVGVAWEAWRLWHWAGSDGALGSQLTPWAPRLFAWQAWRLATSTFTWRGRRAFTLRGRRGTYGSGLALVAR